jgi:hypothetical protein
MIGCFSRPTAKRGTDNARLNAADKAEAQIAAESLNEGNFIFEHSVRPYDDFFQWKLSIGRIAKIMEQEWDSIARAIANISHIECAIAWV